MSAPQTNIEKQERRHKPSLLGIKGALLFGAICVISVMIYAAVNGGDPTADDVTNADQATEPTASTPAVDEVEPGTNESN